MHPIKQRDGHAWRGRFRTHRIDWRAEVERDRAGRVVTAPPCYHLEHRGGVCPLGLRHRVDERAGRNTVMDAWYAAILDGAGEVAGAPSIAITYVSAGTGAATPAVGDTALGAEVWRDQWTAREQGTATEQTHYFFIAQQSANVFLHEFGAWCGAATATAGSGILVARWLDDYDKDSTMSINGQWTLAKG